MAATCEAFVLAQKLGLDPQTFFDISSKASGQSWSMTSYCPVPGVGPETPADRDYEGGFAAALMLKDLKLAMEAARESGAYTPMGGEAEELYQRFVDRGGGTKDFSALIKMIDDGWIFVEVGGDVNSRGASRREQGRAGDEMVEQCLEHQWLEIGPVDAFGGGD